MDKSPDAFRTISEVAETLETPAHVLRFWESRFPQIKPVKRAGGRRYYRPADVALLSGIRHLLHDEGMTIRGVQKILREQGVRHVAGMIGGAEVDFDLEDMDADPGDVEPETAQVIALDATARRLPEGDKPAGPAEVHDLWPEPPGPVEAIVTPVQEDAPEAPHVWVEAEPELAFDAPTPLLAPAGPPTLHGFAARLRALQGPISASALAGFTEVHSRLGLLHAQMAEAQRPRR